MHKTIHFYYSDYYYIYIKEIEKMPYITVKMLEGRTEEQKKALVEKVTEAVSETAGAPKENIVVFIEEMTKNHYAVGGKRLSEK
ncbi:2-hydroxymuconate tautomerase [Heyndrickxia oleronia]|uniref:Tautomerase n=1 Tax=Heyndrickxia oleronia TaxID=38875 RepID=A0A8E2IA10_9BACI|nr:2-hydroxymuconate tautomerase [Heyndrickxia oleronia]NYV65819.1 4-oxalocrotonate tautomerase [Bacillus sp. Gen3]MBU5211247.1 4-oxalocrotonate tautomerase [Heyndrickxia oleronia]MEC1376692.1 4-oxalocrotonate tautomerase [Heyndrickxia oleronia]OOP69404.1 4-oxalocrotonate tautomerase [Heyndrickxia oleronia]QQZ07584.1 4-oxalocrotonate tautomerase [Heyndrickxia oleronia]